MSDRRKIVAETIRDYQTRRWVACEHTQLISFGGCADAVLAALDEHDAAEVERLRRAYNALTADRNRLAAQVRDLAAQGGRERDERDEARAEVERLRAELAERTEQAVHGFFADADQRGVHLDGMTVTELCDAVMAAIRKGPGR